MGWLEVPARRWQGLRLAGYLAFPAAGAGGGRLSAGVAGGVTRRPRNGAPNPGGEGRGDPRVGTVASSCAKSPAAESVARQTRAYCGGSASLRTAGAKRGAVRWAMRLRNQGLE